MGWEFWESGLEKYTGANWFTDIKEKFPFPFNKIPADVSWAMATYFELGGAILLVFGLFTRFAAYSLLVLTFVATAAVHWPDMASETLGLPARRREGCHPMSCQRIFFRLIP